MQKENIIFISGKPKSILQTIFASFFYTLTLVLIWIAVNRILHPELINSDEYRGSVILLEMTLFTILFAIFLSARISIIIDLKSRKVYEHYNLGICKFKLTYFENLDNLEYLSIFSPDNKKSFYLMLWFKKNKKDSIFEFSDYNLAFEYAKLISTKLEIDLLDATEKGNFKWIDKTKS